MVSLLARLAPLVITLRGSKRQFSSVERTLAAVQKAREHPASFEPPASIHAVRREEGGWPVYLVGDRNAPHRAIFLHGGVYSFEIDPLHWKLVSEVADASNTLFTVPIMPLAPRGTASTVVPVVADLTAALIDEVGAGNVAIIGDSSGGGMALAVAMELRDRGLPALGATVLISPWLDISGTDPRLTEIAPSDPWLAVPGTHAAGSLYRAELPEDHPWVSPITGSLNGLGPITMFSGTRDILNADATRLVSLAGEQPLDYHEGAGMIHNYPILPMPEGAAARAIIAQKLSAMGLAPS